MLLRSVDVLVVGAGLSGSMFARELSGLDDGLDIVMIDRLTDERYDRYHRICGEAISAQGFKELSMRPRHVRNHIVKAREIWPGDIVIEERAEGHIIDRPAFLRSLHDDVEGKIGLEQSSLRSLRREGDGFIAETSSGLFRCSQVVGADGAFSLVRRHLSPSRPREVIAVKQFIVDETPEKGVIEFTYGQRYAGGYAWRFPCGEMSNVGFPHGRGEAPGNVVEENARYIPIGHVDPLPHSNALLLGDAAGMVNPLSFGGIRVAMLSAQMAARAVAEGETSRYRKWWNRSGFSKDSFWAAYEVSKEWDDDRMAAFMEGFRGGYGPRGLAGAMLRGGEDRLVAKAFLHSFRYGW